MHISRLYTLGFIVGMLFLIIAEQDAWLGLLFIVLMGILLILVGPSIHWKL